METTQKIKKSGNTKFGLKRDIFDSPLWIKSKNSQRKPGVNDFMAYIYIIGNANYKDNVVEIWGTPKKILVRRGQLFTSQLKLSDTFGWSRTRVRNYLNNHKNDLKIDTLTAKDKHNGYTLITIKNYDEISFKRKDYGKKNTLFTLKSSTTNKVNKLNTSSYKEGNQVSKYEKDYGVESYPKIPPGSELLKEEKIIYDEN